MRAYKRHSRRGFTLVELMIVVAIIGILAALAIYGVSRFLASARTSEAKNTIGAISRAAQAAYERQIAASLIKGDGESESLGSSALCDDAVNVPDTVAGVKGQKYQPKTADQNADFNTGTDSVGWKCLRFQISDPVTYMYSYKHQSAPVSGAALVNGFEAGATGDTDGDDVLAKFALTGDIDATSKQLKRSTAVFVENEAE